MAPLMTLPLFETNRVSDRVLTTILTSSLAESRPSLTVTRRVYVPPAVNDALVVAESGELTVTPVPLTTVHAYVSVPFGRPSSVAIAVSVAVAGNVIV